MANEKQKKLRKRVIIEGAIAGIVCAVVVAIYLVVSGIETGAITERDRIQGEIQTVQGQIDTIRNQIDASGRSVEIVNKLRERKNSLIFRINREEARDRLAELRDKYRLSSLTLEALPEQPFVNDQFTTIGVEAVRNEMKLTFGGMSDTQLFSFLDDVQRSFPGLIKFNGMTLKRDKAMDVNILRQVSQGSTPQLVSGEAIVVWYGFKPKIAPETQPAPNTEGVAPAALPPTTYNIISSQTAGRG